jgi:hypothetical protein
MGIAEDGYCKVYVDTDLDKGKLAALLAGLSGGSLSARTIVAADYEIDVLTNEDFHEARRKHGDGFLFYRYYLDVFPRIEATGRYVRCVGDLVEGLWNSGCKAVASSSFEAELPRRGGRDRIEPI